MNQLFSGNKKNDGDIILNDRVENETIVSTKIENKANKVDDKKKENKKKTQIIFKCHQQC
jgi:hypothetical protein